MPSVHRSDEHEFWVVAETTDLGVWCRSYWAADVNGCVEKLCADLSAHSALWKSELLGVKHRLRDDGCVLLSGISGVWAWSFQARVRSGGIHSTIILRSKLSLATTLTHVTLVRGHTLVGQCSHPLLGTIEDELAQHLSSNLRLPSPLSGSTFRVSWLADAAIWSFAALMDGPVALGVVVPSAPSPAPRVNAGIGEGDGGDGKDGQ